MIATSWEGICIGGFEVGFAALARGRGNSNVQCMSSVVRESPANIGKTDLVRGAGVVALSRMGALIEVVTTPAYIWMFGIPTFGLYLVLWSAVNLASNCLDMGFTGALQRVVPQADEARAHAALKIALVIGVAPSLAVAAAVTLAARPLAGLISAAPHDQAQLAVAVALFAWALPLWTFVEVATSALRARRAFGPEVRLRIFWEQVVRLALAGVLLALGVRTLGLIVAHLLSLAVTAGLSMRLILRYYDGAQLRRAPFDRAVLRALLGYGLAMLPGSIIARAFSDLPPVALNVMLPGAAGATAAGLYGVARKVSSIPQVIRQTFSYVMAPLASVQAQRDRAAIRPLYAFATRVSVALALPLCTILILLGDVILTLFSPEAKAALPMLIALVLARGIDAACGPAGPILDMLGQRHRIVLNALSGLVVWTLLALLLVPRMGGAGMAIAVGIGMATSAILALIQVSVTQKIDPFSKRLGIGAAVGTAYAGLLWSIDRSIEPFGDVVEGTVLLLLLVPGVWLGLRFGLSRTDHEALGSRTRAFLLVRSRSR